ncbi:MAG TPA: sigma-70 family RNA polymerase sigma factor [Anaerolineales bacterium]|jgi:RNA polymerase sigma-70 factor (ECF subfamily)
MHPEEDIPFLVTEAQRNPAAFAALYDRFLTPVYRYLHSRVGNPVDAEDLTAQTFLSALERLGNYRENGTFAGWLFAIAHNKLIDHYRREKPQVELDAERGVPGADDPVRDVEKQLDLEKLSTLLRTLNDDEQEIIRLRYVADLSFAEIATTLGKNEDTVKKSLYRLLARVQNQMETR